MSHRPLPNFILHGGDYNPEQWPREVWHEDVRLMKEAGVNVVTLPVFGWVTLQPNEETFDFEWLDEVVDLVHANGISVCMATATAATPAWLDRKYPDVLRVEESGLRRKHGGRHTFCPHSENFRRLSTDLARRLAQRYGSHPAVVLWHVSNEYGNHCYCDLCAAAFRRWLQGRYGTLEEVNRRWYTAFWGATFTDWEEIETPTRNGQRAFQGLLIDYDRFQSESILDAYRAERDVLREVTPNIPVTTNLMGAFKPLDYHRWGREMDVVSWDSYPAKNATPAENAFSHSLMRGLREGQPFLLMEQTPSQQNWQSHNALKRPGVMRLWSYQAMAHGADSVMYFQWRRSRGAQEKLHGAVVEHVGTAEPRVFREVAALGRELAALGDLPIGARVETKAAVLFDWENWWAVEYSSGPSVDLKYRAMCLAYYQALHDQGIVADVVSPDADLSGYELIVVPVLYMVKQGVAERLEAFVQSGGTLVTTFFSGIVDENDLVHLGGYPGPLRRLLGVWVEELDALTSSERNAVLFSGPLGTLECGHICERMHAETAEVLATYEQDFYAGEPAITRNAFGSGEAYYLATQLVPHALSRFLGDVCARRGIKPVLSEVVPGVEATVRVREDGKRLLFVMNHNREAVTVDLPQWVQQDALSGDKLDGRQELAGYGVLIATAT
jgi:beta-galactosidase